VSCNHSLKTTHQAFGQGVRRGSRRGKGSENGLRSRPGDWQRPCKRTDGAWGSGSQSTGVGKTPTRKNGSLKRRAPGLQVVRRRAKKKGGKASINFRRTCIYRKNEGEKNVYSMENRRLTKDKAPCNKETGIGSNLTCWGQGWRLADNERKRKKVGAARETPGRDTIRQKTGGLG